MKLFKKKNKTMLYKKFIQQQASIEEISNGKETQLKEEKRNKKNSRKKRDSEVHINTTLLIAVCSLSTGIGCSHLTKALAYYVKHYLKKTICIVDIQGNYTNEEINGIEVYGKENLFELYDNYNYILLDVGNYNSSLLKEVKMAQIRVMCAVLKESYLHNLAEFVKEEESSSKWKYVFNYVPENLYKKVDDLMEDYEHWCMPINDAKTFSNDTKDKLERIARGIKL